MNKFRRLKELKAISKSGLFDSAWYLDNHADVKVSGADPLIHYYDYGCREGRRASPYFDTRRYLRLFPHVLEQNINPIVHFLDNCKRDPRVLHFETALVDSYDRFEKIERTGCFDHSWYLATNPDVAKKGVHPLVHYIDYGHKEGRLPSPNPDHCVLVEQILSSGPRSGPPVSPTDPSTINKQYSYQDWISDQIFTDEVRELQRRLAEDFALQPLFSFIVPVYKVSHLVVRDLIDSILAQSYENWEVCFVLAYHENENLSKLLHNASKSNHKIKLRKLDKNLGISGNSNAALEQAKGDYIVLLDHDDMIAQDALFEFTKAINASPQIDLIYSDKDMISESGSDRFHPLFKPEWSPDIMLNANYITHLNAIRTNLVHKIGGWDSVTDGAQDWDIFFRVIESGGVVHHIPKVLYHWRLVATSVAASGLAAKPYAAMAQLEAVKRGLRSYGWQNAEPNFIEDQLIRIDWNCDILSETLVISLGRNGKAVQKIVASATKHVYLEIDENLAENLNKVIQKSASKYVVIMPDILQPQTADWLNELVSPLTNPNIGATTGKLIGRAGEIVDSGWIVSDGKYFPLFRGYASKAYSEIGFVNWYRNVAAISFATLAFRRNTWSEVGAFKSGVRTDLQFSSEIERSGKRLLVNPFCESTMQTDIDLDAYFFGENVARLASDTHLTKFFSPSLFIGQAGKITLRRAVSHFSEHSFANEAQFVAGRYDFDKSKWQKKAAIPAKRDETAKSKVKNKSLNATHARKSAPSSFLFVVPDFSTPFYGGVMTILRFCDYLVSQAGKSVTIAVLGADDASQVRRTIRLAFPTLAELCQIICLEDGESLDPHFTVPVDIGFCSLWTTAFCLRDMKNCRKKFYFMQDYEPLFYPAGVVSKVAESTYSFGFHGVANTPTLSELYERHGGTASHFYPSVDRNIFFSKGMRKSNVRRPQAVFAYMRPGHPRNCFEMLATGFREIKAIYGDRVSIYTAGAPWSLDQFNLRGVVNHLGLLPYAETANLYRSIDIGVVAMATPHPSYIPFELMACGATVASTRNSGTQWFFEDGKNAALFDYNANSFVETLSDLMDNTDRARAIGKSGEKLVSSSYGDWVVTCKQILNIVMREWQKRN